MAQLFKSTDGKTAACKAGVWTGSGDMIGFRIVNISRALTNLTSMAGLNGPVALMFSLHMGSKGGAEDG
jgi:hypothetical protein